MKRIVTTFIVVFFASFNIVSADLIQGIDIDFVTIGNQGNPGDNRSGAYPGGTIGAVDYEYRIGKYEITNAQWNAFVSDAGAPTGNPWYAYEADAVYTGAEQPTNSISWYEAAQFCNYLTSGDKSQGAYLFSGDNSNPGDFLGIDRNAAVSTYQKVYFLPTQNEWYKAAYYKPDGSGYSTFANGTDTPPVAGIDTNYGQEVPYDGPWDVGTGTEEQNGTFDMMGNVGEWVEPQYYGSSHYPVWGGWFYVWDVFEDWEPLSAFFFFFLTPYSETYGEGFRVAINSTLHTIERSGVGFSFFHPGHENFSIDESQYDGGVVLGDGYDESEPRYEFYFPGNQGTQQLLTSLTVYIYGDGDITNLIVGTNIIGPVSDNWSITYSSGEISSHLGHSMDDVNGDILRIYIDVLSGVILPGERYDLEKIIVEYEYLGVDSSALDYYHKAYSAYRFLTEYRDQVLQDSNSSIWKGNSNEDRFYEAILESKSFAMNLRGLSGNIFTSVKTFFDEIKVFKSIVDLLYQGIDYANFIGTYYGKNGDDVTDKINNAFPKLADLANIYQDYGFNGIFDTNESAALLFTLEDANTTMDQLRSEIEEACGDLFFYAGNNPLGSDTAHVAIRSFRPLLWYDYNEGAQDLPDPDPNSYLLKFLEFLEQEISDIPILTVTLNPPDIRNEARWRLTSGPDTSWKESDETIIGLPLSSYTLECNEVTGWKKPDDLPISINPGINSETGTYYEHVYFPDPNLKAAVEDELGIVNPTTPDMLDLTYLVVYYGGITDLTGLEHASNMTVLWLVFNQISDISALSGMTNMTALCLYSNQISDISALSGMTNMAQLDLQKNQISDISALSGMTNMTKLWLYSNHISDISALSGMTNMAELWLNNNQISDISALSGMTNMTELWLNNNQISDISALSGMTNLNSLRLGYNQISDISALSGMTNMIELWLGYGNNINDISALSGMTNLNSLNLTNNPIGDITVLSGMTNMTELWLNSTFISDISALSGMTNMIELGLGNNQLSDSDITALSGMTNLTKLYLYSNQISDISALSEMTNMTKVWLNNNQISDISALSEMVNLTYLNLNSNQLNTSAYCLYLSLIEYNNPGVSLYYDTNPNPLTVDCSTDFIEFATFASQWLEPNCNQGNNWCNWADLNHINGVGLDDLAEFTQLWLANPAP